MGEQGGIGYWPHDPWTHQPMKQSKAWGNFTYVVSTTRDSFTITAHFSRGGALTFRGATATSPWHRLRLALEDATLERDLDIIDGYVRLYAAGHSGLLPAPSELTPTGAVGQSHAGWPSDPYSGDPLTIGEGVGHFAYTAGEDGLYSLSAPLAGSDAPYVVGGGRDAGRRERPERGRPHRRLGATRQVSRRIAARGKRLRGDPRRWAGALLATAILGAAGAAAAPQQAAGLTVKDLQAKQGVLLLRGYIDRQAAANGFVYPANGQVKKGGGLVAPVWPLNPYTGRPMASGSGRGTYRRRPGRAAAARPDSSRPEAHLGELAGDQERA